VVNSLGLGSVLVLFLHLLGPLHLLLQTLTLGSQCFYLLSSALPNLLFLLLDFLLVFEDLFHVFLSVLLDVLPHFEELALALLVQVGVASLTNPN